MRAKAWSNGSPRPTGAGYGVKIGSTDRDRFFERTCSEVTIELPHETATVGLSPSFWRTCTELRSSAIGRWLQHEGVAPWPTGHPTVLQLEPVGANRFRLSR
jgi:hypothetical protein